MITGRLEGQVAVVTSAGRGLGRAYAEYLAAEGGPIVVNSNGQGSDGERAAEVVETIRATGGTVVTDTRGVEPTCAER
jgi:NAD(P)-dependent dehydrogenase (short-subunit alcohol dehydrogenase family)